MADKITEKVKELMGHLEQIRNISVAAHIDHGIYQSVTAL